VNNELYRNECGGVMEWWSDGVMEWWRDGEME